MKKTPYYTNHSLVYIIVDVDNDNNFFPKKIKRLKNCSY